VDELISGTQVDELTLPASCRCLLLGLNGSGALAGPENDEKSTDE